MYSNKVDLELTRQNILADQLDKRNIKYGLNEIFDGENKIAEIFKENPPNKIIKFRLLNDDYRYKHINECGLEDVLEQMLHSVCIYNKIKTKGIMMILNEKNKDEYKFINETLLGVGV